MKLFRKTIFWIVALVAVAGAFSLIDERADVARKVEQANLKLLPFDVGDIDEFWTKSAEAGIQIKAVKQRDGWWLTQPLSARGDQEAIEKLLHNVVKSRKDAVLFEKPSPEKLKELGLDDPKRQFAIKVRGKDTIIHIGDKGPTLNIAYAMFEGETRVFRIHSDVRTEAGSSVYMLRDKTVLAINPVKLRRIEIERKGMEKVVIVHDQGKWNMAEPQEARANQTKVLETLFDLKNAQVKEFLDETPSDLKAYGLELPALRISVLQQGEDTPLILNIGSRDRTRRGFFANNGGETKVYLAEEGLVNALLAKAGNWKEPD